MVKILKIYNGANDIEGITSPRRMLKDRFQYIYKYLNYTKAIKFTPYALPFTILTLCGGFVFLTPTNLMAFV
jgi:hypothetical protein